MKSSQGVMYDLLLKPLRYDPELTESVIFGLKWTLSAMFDDPFPVRDVIVAAREVVDNILTHADWEAEPAPSLFVRYRVHKRMPQLIVSSTNRVKDLEEAQRAVRFIEEYIENQSSPALYRELTAHLVESSDIESNGGIGLLQVASSPRCRLDVRLEGSLFHVRVDVDVPELRATQPYLSGKTGS